MRISVFGLGKLGAPLAAVLAAKGFDVVCVDINESAVEAVNAGRPPVDEAGLKETMQKAEGRLTATVDAPRAVAETDMTFLVVPTPSLADGRFSLKYVLEAADAVGAGLARKAAFHLVVLTSTVMPGDTMGRVWPALEAASGKTCGRDFGLCYNPEFVALGSVIRDTLRPDFVLIGESDEGSGQMLAQVYQHLCENSPPVARMNLVNAELAKLSVNTFVTTRISYANMLAQLCERLPGADVDVVTSALGLDGRIGRKYLRGAVSYGGPCFPRDNLAFIRLARDFGADPAIAEATEKMNRLQRDHLYDITTRCLPPGGTAGILGLSYKPETGVVEGSPSIELARRLLERGFAVVGYDPKAMLAARALLGDNMEYAPSAAACAARADVLVAMVSWAEFRALSAADLKKGPPPPTVVDCWRIFSAESFGDACVYVAPGMGPAGNLAASVKKLGVG